MSVDTAAAEHHHNADATDVFGFWLYIMTDCILFASLFATFLVLHHPGAVGPPLKLLIDLPYVLVETFFLLASNFTFCLAIFGINKNKLPAVIFWLILTFILGAGFVVMEVMEFIHLNAEGYSWHVSGAASAFFTLVGTHGFHVTMGLLWILIMIIQLPILKINKNTARRMVYLGLFWNFLDIVWIFLFTIVYLMGAVL
ncbi:cytochrome o ubiquinol oxidase subunit III [Coxiella burnetii]|uniref:cytochrome o ubiquinol oxidase subunit III n=1 Tax=Coxiella burnetii TaxID=777 RepID=UPI000594124F|nr:cytochrome o ubiquinol oxidase subunit III [Coxiella burnetii]ATN74440.1 cytochrome o ubiquinol oxidase subunit III [Coxiella burnetii]ATN76344.1 cytochrome o ubiquinol oxidase subunit III [Coxiella burnetii]ATN78259.1 cytochrome o ubiquinol oxidase subunit III [Coxiella burnetii]ATN80174.1 cytochrome o ubiquinol oxidase subunit III [Coxiella burnetii]OYK91357.1 cytochrome o ubiquinol oxidase subunit III [Coxiella burnetii]